MRLIDANYFKECIVLAYIKNNMNTDLGLALLELIDSVPTAYDVDKVVEQLEQKGNNIFASHFPEDEQEFMDNGIAKGFWQSAKIVKEGGVDE